MESEGYFLHGGHTASVSDPRDPTRTSPTTTTTNHIPNNPNNNNRRHSPQTIDDRQAGHPQHLRSCVTCRRRKVKCDKQDPCSHCIRGRTECVYPAPGRAPRKPRQTGAKPVSERETELLKRLRRLEGVVEELSGQVELGSVRQSPLSDHSGTPGSSDAKVRVVGMDEGTRKDWLVKQSRIGIGPPKKAFTVDSATQGMGKLVLEEGKSKYVASPFWASITDEVAEINEMLEEHEWSSDSDTPVLPSDAFTEPNHQAFIMGYSSVDVKLKNLHPVPDQIPIYWQTFLENVQPMTMLIHAPTVAKTIKQVETNIENLSPSTEALLFSIYFAAITSMSAEEAKRAFKTGKEELLKQYRFGCEQSLARAGFLNTDEIVTVQAFVLFLVCVRRHDDTRFAWSLTGLALRISQGLGLHRDGTRFNLSPFDTEMRRRLWYHVLILDLRAAEDHGTDPSIIECTYDTEYPSNINDEDISPDDDKPPVARDGPTDMTFSLIRCEIVSLVRKLISLPITSPNYRGPTAMTLEEKETLLKETSLRLEDKYLKYCENAGPLFWVAASIARLILVKMNLLIYHPLTQPGNHQQLSPALRDKLLISSIEIIEYARIIESEVSTKKWGWIHHTYIQWHAIAFILGELADRDDSPQVQRAWAAVNSVFDPWGGSAAVLQKDGMLWQPLRKLMAKAKKRREQNKIKDRPVNSLNSSGTSQSPASPFNGQYPIQQVDCRKLSSGGEHVAPGFGNGVQPVPPPPTSMYPQNIPPSNPNNKLIQNINSAPTPAQYGPMPMPPPQQINPQQQQRQQQQPFFDDSFLDVDMNTLDNVDMNWSGWDDMVRDFQLEADIMARDNNGRGPTMGGIGNWW